MPGRTRSLGLVTATLAITLVAGCAAQAPAPSELVGPHLRTAEVANCAGVGLVDALLHGSPADNRVAWIALGADKRLETVWPVGFTARFAPDLEVLDASGSVIAHEGDSVTGACTMLPDDAVFVTPAEIFRPSAAAGPALATSPPSSIGGGDSRWEGVLGGELRGDTACFWTIGPNGTPGAALVWPYGFTASTDPLALLGPEGAVIARPGDSLVLGGGGPPVNYVIPPDRDPCRIGSIFVVGQVISR